jgi:hypothetical protein
VTRSHYAQVNYPPTDLEEPFRRACAEVGLEDAPRRLDGEGEVVVPRR